jgi:[protein-PII] uridylyltransferase
MSGRLDSPPGAQLLLDTSGLDRSIANSSKLLDPVKHALQTADGLLAERFWQDEPVDLLVRSRAWVVEQLLVRAWQEMMPADKPVAMVAVGGFGRGELHPHSDVDLMILIASDPPDEGLKGSIEAFLTLLWDAGLYLGHSVRTPAQCEEEARADVVTATNLMESRLMAGDMGLFSAMRAFNSPDKMWAGPAFFDAKYHEQLQRHERFHETAYNLEPNIKEGPGGLRDIQMISWVTKRHLAADSLHGLVEHGFLTETEFQNLHAGQQFLWRVRFALHLLAGRAEDRLLFDFQRQIASGLGYGDEPHSNASVERFMQQYYRVVMQLERLNESLLQLFREELLTEQEQPVEHHAGELGEHFMVQNGFLGVRDPQLFEKQPDALIRMFVLLAGHPEILGVRAATIRQIRDFVHHIDDQFADRPGVLAGFYELLRQPSGIYTQLQRMNRYGVLAALLPAFGLITGRMQFDLFHVFTVDQHILFVVRNLRRFAYGKYAEHFPHLAGIFRRIEKPELLYLAALFHDIAKGREGDHSQLGETDALEFCRKLDLADEDGALVAWLVGQHLLMSQTAQRKDISDPDIVAGFVDKVVDRKRLEHLYLLTVADIAATSPNLWNNWKSGLLRELYLSSLNVLERGSKPQMDRVEHLASARSEAMQELVDQGHERGEILKIWQWLPSNAFQRYSVGQMTWATGRILQEQGSQDVIVSIRARAELGISEILVYAPDYTGLIASTTSVFDEMGLNVLSARVLTTRNERSFDLFQVMDARGQPLNEGDCGKLKRKLGSVLAGRKVMEPVHRKLPRRLRPFVSAPIIRFDTARSGTVTSLELECTDRPGLLSQLAAAMVACDIRIHDAMIATFGDRVEDTFLVTDRYNRLMNEDLQAMLVTAINQRLKG